MADSKSLETFRRIVMPVLNALQTKSFKTTFIHQAPPEYTRPECTAHVEAFCRVVMSVAPLFHLSDADAAARGLDDIRHAYVNSWNVVIEEKYIDWNCGEQLLVEVGNLAYSFLLYPNSWNVLSTRVQIAVLAIFKRASDIKPYTNNWLLFKSIVDIFLHKHKILRAGGLDHVYKLLDIVESWYVGDSWYKDGPGFHMDYYNSFVILPFLYVIYNELRKDKARPVFQTRFQNVVSRIGRHAEFLERLIAPDGTFPLFGRSSVYRSAVFHTLAFCAAHVPLPSVCELSYGQIRRALERVHVRLFGCADSDAQFDAAGYLQLGFMGSQIGVAHRYSNNGSCYFTGLSFLALGLPDSHPFWSARDEMYTQEIAWCCVGSPALKKDTNRT